MVTQLLSQFRIGARIAMVVAVLVATACFVAGVAVYSFDRYQERVAAIDAASQRAIYSERVNGLVYAAVMESRGIYMSTDAGVVRRYGDNLLRFLTQIEETMRLWESSINEELRESFTRAKDAVAQFVRFRRELVRLSRDVGQPEARAFGDNDANRNVRTAMSNALTALAEQDRQAVTNVSAQAEGYYWSGRLLVVGGAVCGIVVALLLAGYIAIGTISRPIRRLTGAMQTLAGGNTQIEVPGRGRGDEIGQMAESVEVFRTNMEETDRLRAEQEQMKAKAEQERKAALAKVAGEFEASVGGVVRMIAAQATELQASANSLSATAEETNRQSTEVASSSEEASANVQTVASAAEELTASISEINRQVTQSSTIARNAVSQAQQTNASIQSLAEAAQGIGDVVKLIADIAGQTNLLALNATIEAARAGEAGKGFAVVAAEVKTLATRTAKATDEISAKIAEMQEATGSNVTAIVEIGKVIGEIEQIASAIASAVEEQSVTTQEIARNVQQAASGTMQVSSGITVVSKAASETGSAATQVLSAAGELSKQSETLRAEVDKFLSELKAA